MAKFIPYDYNQSSMVVINFNDQIQTGTFEHAVHHLVDNKLDLSLFERVYKNDDNGRPARRNKGHPQFHQLNPTARLSF